MKPKRFTLLIILAAPFLTPFNLLAATPTDFNAVRIDEIWKQLWQSADPKVAAPKIEKLSEKQVIDRFMGNWTVMFGVMPDRLTISLSTNRAVVVAGQKGGKAWKKSGQWRVVSGKLILFLEQEDIPSFIFRSGGREYIFDRGRRR
jgi:hypothetical protein